MTLKGPGTFLVCIGLMSRILGVIQTIVVVNNRTVTATVLSFASYSGPTWPVATEWTIALQCLAHNHMPPKMCHPWPPLAKTSREGFDLTDLTALWVPTACASPGGHGGRWACGEGRLACGSTHMQLP